MTIKPALTPERWANPNEGWPTYMVYPYVAEDGSLHMACDDSYYGWDLDEADRHALAALCLRGQPVGFTHADVDNHRMMAEHLDLVVRLNSQDAHARLTAEWHRSMADRIEALLAPEGK